jgi:hypothetical protein
VNSDPIESYNFHYTICDALYGIRYCICTPHGFEVVSSYYNGREIVEQAIDNPLMKSSLPTLSLALLIFGLVGLGVRDL